MNYFSFKTFMNIDNIWGIVLNTDVQSVTNSPGQQILLLISTPDYLEGDSSRVCEESEINFRVHFSDV